MDAADNDARITNEQKATYVRNRDTVICIEN